jgi:hypothetical protein
VRRHEADGVSLVFGVIFCGIAGLWALVAGDVIGFDGLRVAIPIVLILAGLSGVGSTLAAGRRRRTARPVAPPPPVPTGSADDPADQSTGSPTSSST